MPKTTLAFEKGTRLKPAISVTLDPEVMERLRTDKAKGINPSFNVNKALRALYKLPEK